VWKTLLRPRTLIYSGIWGGIGLAMLFALGTRQRTDISAAADRNPPFMLMSDGSVRNSYTLKLRNMQSRPREMEVALVGLPDAMMWSDDMARDQAARALKRKVPADATMAVRAYVIAPRGAAAQTFAFKLTVLDQQGETDRSEVRFETPGDE
jgi:polyferredoxin